MTVEPTRGSLDGRLVAVSISNPPEGDLVARGLSQEHVDHAFIELARQLLAAGASLAYGGDFRAGGYTEKLIALLKEYAERERPAQERVRQYLAWPRYQRAKQRRAELKLVATAVELPAPVADPPDPSTFDPASSPEARALNADSLSLMRKQMTDDLDARIVLGGKTAGHTSRYPGIAEEAFLAAQRGAPLFVLGGFGGCAARLVDLARGERAPELTYAFQVEHTDGYAALAGRIGDIDFETINEAIEGHLRAGAATGLDAYDHERLWVTTDLDEAVALVLKGLGRGPEPELPRAGTA